MKKEAIRVSTTVPAAPTTLYYAWLSSEQHSAMTGGGTAKIDPTVGAKFSAVNGTVTGKLVILDLGRRMVMSWRCAEFPREEHDSKVEVHLEALGGSTRVTIIHSEIPEGLSERVRSIWNDTYFGPMRTFFSKFLPDPRNPPPPRRPPPPPEDEEEEVEEAPPEKSAKGTPSSGKTTPPPKGKVVEKPTEKTAPKPEKKLAKPEKKADKPEKAVAKKSAKPEKPEKKASKSAKPEKKADKKSAKKADAGGKPKKKKKK